MPLPHTPCRRERATRDRPAIAVAVRAELPVPRPQRHVGQSGDAALEAAAGVVRVACHGDSRGGVADEEVQARRDASKEARIAYAQGQAGADACALDQDVGGDLDDGGVYKYSWV